MLLSSNTLLILQTSIELQLKYECPPSAAQSNTANAGGGGGGGGADADGDDLDDEDDMEGMYNETCMYICVAD